MALEKTACRGCLLGLAVGDAMGYAVDSRSLPEICRDYGPNGLMGYDLANGYADISSYTQLAAFTANGLLLGLTRMRVLGKKAPLVRYIDLALREWAAFQRPWGRPDRTHCWLARKPQLCRRRCMDTRMLDTLSREKIGTPDAPVNRSDGAYSLTTAVAVGLFAHRVKLSPQQRNDLAAGAVALTQGSPAAFLSGALLSTIIDGLLQKPRISLEEAARQGCDLLEEQFGHRYSQTFEITRMMRQALAFAGSPNADPRDVMELLRCDDAPSVLAGAVYACLVSGGDFDRGMILAVNHSGRSAAVGAVTGSILGLLLGEMALPEFYLESLEPGELLRELADDLVSGCPVERGSRLFDLDWEYKYLQGGQ